MARLSRWRHILGLGLLIGLVGLAAAPAPAFDLSGKYDFDYLFFRIKAEIIQRGQDLSGILYVENNISGAVDTYHFEGRLEGDRVWAKHKSGHVFTGRVIDGVKVEGALKTVWKNEHTLTVDTRQAKAEVSRPAQCAYCHFSLGLKDYTGPGF